MALEHAAALGGRAAGRSRLGLPAFLDVNLFQKRGPALFAAAFLTLAAGIWRGATVDKVASRSS